MSKAKYIFLITFFLIFAVLLVKHFAGENVRPIPKYWSVLPFLHTKMASSIYPNIYLTDIEYKEYKANNMSVLTQSVLIHEKEHIKNWEKIGYLKFSYLYLTNKSFRLEEELRAISVQMQFLKENGALYDIERKAKQFSGKEYRQLLLYEEAKKLLEDLWENIGELENSKELDSQ